MHISDESEEEKEKEEKTNEPEEREALEKDENQMDGDEKIESPEKSNNDDEVFEKTPLEKLALDGQLNAFKHEGFWRPMDTLKDKIELNNYWENNNAPWKVWDRQKVQLLNVIGRAS